MLPVESGVRFISIGNPSALHVHVHVHVLYLLSRQNSCCLCDFNKTAELRSAAPLNYVKIKRAKVKRAYRLIGVCKLNSNQIIVRLIMLGFNF